MNVEVKNYDADKGLEQNINKLSNFLKNLK